MLGVHVRRRCIFVMLLTSLLLKAVPRQELPVVIINAALLHFALVVDDAKCIIGHARVCVCLCVCVCGCLPVRRRMRTLLHGPGCNLGNGRGAH